MTSSTKLIKEWTGSVVFVSSKEPLNPSTSQRPASPITTPKYHQVLTPKRGTESSPISIASSSPEITDNIFFPNASCHLEKDEGLSEPNNTQSRLIQSVAPCRPRAVPRYASKLPRTAFTPPRAQTIPSTSARPFHPFFISRQPLHSTQNINSNLYDIDSDKTGHSETISPLDLGFAPMASQPRRVATYSSTSASSSQSSGDDSVRSSNSQESTSQVNTNSVVKISTSEEDSKKHMDDVVANLNKLSVTTSMAITSPMIKSSSLTSTPQRTRLIRIVPKLQMRSGVNRTAAGPMSLRVRGFHSETESMMLEEQVEEFELVEEAERVEEVEHTELLETTEVNFCDQIEQATASEEDINGEGLQYTTVKIDNTSTEQAQSPPPQSVKPSTPFEPFDDPSKLPFFSYSTPLPPHFQRPPQIVYTSVPDEASELLQCLRGPVLGFDMEWPRPGGFQTTTDLMGKKVTKAVGGVWDNVTRKWKFPEKKTAMIQVCDEKTIILFHLRNQSKLPQAFVDFITDPTIYKTGVQIRGDGQKLVRDFPNQFNHSFPSSTSSSSSSLGINRGGSSPKSLLELTQLARAIDPENADPGARLMALAKLARMYLGRDLDKDSTIRQGDWDQTLSREQIHYAANDVYASLLIYKHLDRLAKQKGRLYSLDACCQPINSSLQLTDRLLKTSRGNFNSHPSIDGSDMKITPAQSRALGMFLSGQNVENLAQDLNVKESTVLNYLLQAVQAVTVDRIPLEARKRLANQVPPSSFAGKKHRELLKQLSSHESTSSEKLK